MNDKALSDTDTSKKILEVTGYVIKKGSSFQNQLEKGLSILQCYLFSLGEEIKWQTFLDNINKLHKEHPALSPENEAFKSTLNTMLNDVQKLLASNTTNPILASDVILNWFAITEKKSKKSETIAGNIEEDILKECTSPDFFTQDTLLLISNSKNILSVRFKRDEGHYECFNKQTGSFEQFSAPSELIAFLKKTMGQDMKLEWVTWNETTDLNPVSRYKNELLSNHALTLLSKTGLHFLAEVAPNELKNILEQAKENNNVSDAVEKALITTDNDGCTGFFSMAEHAGDQIETLLALAKLYGGIRQAIAKALVMVGVKNRTGFWAILAWVESQLTPLFDLAKTHKEIREAVANALVMKDSEKDFDDATGFLLIASWCGKQLANLFELAKNHPEIRDAIAQALPMTDKDNRSGLYAMSGFKNARHHFNMLFSLAENNDEMKNAIAEALSIRNKRTQRNAYFAMAYWGSPSELKALHDLSQGHEKLKKAIADVQSIDQPSLIEKIFLFMELDAGSPLTDAEKNKIDEGLCYGLSVVYSYMSITGKLAWWIDALQGFNKWDGTKESLDENIVDSSEDDPEAARKPGAALRRTRHYLFNRVVNYALYNNKQSVKEGRPEESEGRDLNLFLKPLQKDEIRTNAFRFFSEKSHIAQHEGYIAQHARIAGHFNEAVLNNILVGTHFALEAIYLLRNDGHVGSIRYSVDDSTWFLYNPNRPEEESFHDDDVGRKNLIDKLHSFFRSPNPSISIEIATLRKDVDLSFFSTFYESLSPEEMLSLFQGTGLHEVSRWTPEHLPRFLEFAKTEVRAQDAIASAMSRTTYRNWNLLQTIGKCAASQLPTLLELAETHEGIKNSIRSVLTLENEKKYTALSIINKSIVNKSAPPDVLVALSRLTGISCVDAMSQESAAVSPKSPPC